jgi:twitching motility protein PilT
MRLLPRADQKGRVPAVEILINTPYINECIIEPEKTKLIKDAVQDGVSQYGMQTFDQSLYFLYQKGLITYDEALKWASNPDEFKLKKIGLQTSKEMSLEEMEKRMSESSDTGNEKPLGGMGFGGIDDHNLLELDGL